MCKSLKFALAILAGIEMSLTACNTISDRSQPTPTSTTPAQTPPATLQAKREDYQSIALSDVGNADTLTGNDPQAIALSTFGNIESEGGSQNVTVDYPQANQAIVTITQTGVADDSVGSIRYRVEFQQHSSPNGGKQWKMIWAGSQVKCHPGRGHQDWSTELCV
ncbi:MAG TPA: hypothetical protein DCY91_12710 [Cyanobacteria bacterium UBA11370]|nr:hypothetical protein [Cyanobacteria bacterium UBA11370]